MNLVHSPKTVLVAIVIKSASSLHPPMPAADTLLHGLKRQMEPQRAEIVPHMLRHPIIMLIQLVHAQLLLKVKKFGPSVVSVGKGVPI